MCLIKHHPKKNRRSVEVWLQAPITSAVNKVQWSASHHGRNTTSEVSPVLNEQKAGYPHSLWGEQSLDPTGNRAKRVQKMYAYYEKSCTVDLHYHVLLYLLNTLHNRKYLMQLIFAIPSPYLCSLSLTRSRVGPHKSKKCVSLSSHRVQTKPGAHPAY
jgi:hypothetical protein